MGIDEMVVLGRYIAFLVTPFMQKDDLGFGLLLIVPG